MTSMLIRNPDTIKTMIKPQIIRKKKEDLESHNHIQKQKDTRRSHINKVVTMKNQTSIMNNRTIDNSQKKRLKVRNPMERVEEELATNKGIMRMIVVQIKVKYMHKQKKVDTVTEEEAEVEVEAEEDTKRGQKMRIWQAKIMKAHHNVSDYR